MQLINALLPPEGDVVAIKRWRSIMGLAVLLLILNAFVGWQVFAHKADIEKLTEQVEARSEEIADVSTKVDRGTELQLISLTRSLHDQLCRAETARDREALRRMIDRYEQEYRVLTRAVMPSPAVSC